VLEDGIGLKLAASDAGWRERSDMDPKGDETLPRIHRRAAFASSKIWS